MQCQFTMMSSGRDRCHPAECNTRFGDDIRAGCVIQCQRKCAAYGRNVIINSLGYFVRFKDLAGFGLGNANGLDKFRFLLGSDFVIDEIIFQRQFPNSFSTAKNNRCTKGNQQRRPVSDGGGIGNVAGKCA